ncbi:MAG: hypothetical protein OXC31_25050 [Spirochaetaceae bacterium]|nr:hypothetical protein [Spirochaetaceae bacterium]
MTIQNAFRVATLAAFLPVAAGVSADAPSWLHEAIRKENPEELGYRVFVELDCPIGRRDVERIVDATMARNELTRSQFAFVETHLQVALSCFLQEDEPPIFSQEVHFSPPRDTERPDLVYDWNFGRYGVGGRTFILESVTRSIEDAIAEYVLANFS